MCQVTEFESRVQTIIECVRERLAAVPTVIPSREEALRGVAGTIRQSEVLQHQLGEALCRLVRNRMITDEEADSLF